MNYTQLTGTFMTGDDGAYAVSAQYGNTAVAMAACDARPTCLAFSEYTNLNSTPQYHLHDTNNINKVVPQSTDAIYISVLNMNTYVRDFAPFDKNNEDIDNKIKEIYHAPGTITANFDENYRATMMMGTIVAMLGTAVLYLAVAL